jgi:hypothetical protein
MSGDRWMKEVNSLTANTIAYGGLLESQRHNLEVERVNLFNARENARHNKENEAIGWFNGQENARHNVEGEKISWFNAYEKQRSDLANEQIKRDELAELNRTNTVKEAETERADRAREDFNYQSMLFDWNARIFATKKNNETSLAVTQSNNASKEKIAVFDGFTKTLNQMSENAARISESSMYNNRSNY